MNEYANVIRDTLNGKETGYRYPGEILERCIVNTPERSNEVLEGFLEFVSDSEKLETLRNTENAFNSNQIDMFVEHIGNYKAVLLKYLLEKETVAVKSNYLNSVDDYVYLGEYIKTLTEEDIIDEALVSELTEEFSKIIPLMEKTLYDDELLTDIAYYINLFELDSKYQKEEKKYLSLIRKATDNVLSDSDISKLQSYGYSLLKIRKLNALNLGSNVTGRRDKVWFLFLKEAFLGTEALSEKEKEIISVKIKEKCINTDGREMEWSLERAIDGQKSMLSALSYYKFKETSANASFCLSFMSEYDHYDMTRNISLKGEVFDSFTEAQKNIIYTQYMKRSDDDEKLCYCKERILNYDQEGRYLFGLSAERIIELINKGILTVDELDNPNVKMGNLVEEAFKKASKTTLEILRKYSDKAPDIFEYLDSAYYQKDPDGIYLVKGENLSVSEITELYEIKENYFFRYAPFLYVKFILSVIRETKTQIHSKDEWLMLLDYLEEAEYNILHIKKEILTEDEYAEIIRKREEKEQNQKRSFLMEQIEKATSANDIEWYQISKDMLDVKRAACLKILELKDYSYNAKNQINDAYYEDIISDEEFLKFHKGKKELEKKKRDKEAA